MRFLRYLSRALSKPALTLGLIRRFPPRVGTVWKTRGVGRSIGFFLYYVSHYMGIPLDAPYWALVRLIQGKNLVKTQVLGREMLVDLNDKGISRQLWLEGVREHGAVAAFKQELQHLQKSLGTNLIILDIGSNIGFYVLVEASTVEGKIYAIEPAPANIRLLSENVRLNSFAQRVDITHGALSNHTGTGRLFLSEESNVHSMERKSHKYIEVPTWTANEFLRIKGIQPHAVHVVRMDTEGHEANILEGMTDILNLSTPMLLFIEFHANLVQDGRLMKVISQLKEAGFRVSYACNDYFTGIIEEFGSLDVLSANLHRHAAAEVFLRRGY